jgi:ribosomal protein S6--L-glutamate ligase
MKLAVLSTHVGDDEARLIEAAEKRGLKAKALDVKNFGIHICSSDPHIFYNGKRIDDKYDIVLPRIDPPYTEFGFKVLRQFQAMGVYVTDTAYSLELARNKMRCMQYLMRKGIPFPKTAFAYSKENFDDILASVGGALVVIKLNEGTEGVGVFLAEDEKTAKNFLRTFKQLNVEIMVQQFIAESSGTDVRLIVIDGEVFTALRRTSADGDFRSNIAQGGAYDVVSPSPEEQREAIEAAETMGLSIAGIDLVRSSTGPMIIEINSALDFAGPRHAEEVTGLDIAGTMIDCAVKGKAKFDKDGQGWLD